MSAMDRSLVPLQQANLCLDCDIISTGHTYCYACGSTALLNLARTLDGRDYTNSVPQAFAQAAEIANRELEAHDARSNRLRRTTQFAGMSASRLQVFSEADRNEDEIRRWSSLRGVASVVQRALTVVLVVVALGLVTRSRADTLDHSVKVGLSLDPSVTCGQSISAVTID